jgi:hypothetical protein
MALAMKGWKSEWEGNHAFQTNSGDEMGVQNGLAMSVETK